MKILITSDLVGNRFKFLELKGVVNRFHPDNVILLGSVFSKIEKTRASRYYHSLENYDILDSISKICKVYICFASLDSSDIISEFNKNNNNKKIIDCTNKIIQNDITFVFDNSIRENNAFQNEWTLSDIKNGQIEKNIKVKLKEIDIAKSLWFTYSNPSSIYPIEYMMEKFPFELYFNKRFCHDCYNYRKVLEGDFSNGKQPIAFISSYIDPNHEKYTTGMLKINSCLCFRSGQYNNALLNYVMLEIKENAITNWFTPFEGFNII